MSVLDPSFIGKITVSLIAYFCVVHGHRLLSRLTPWESVTLPTRRD